MFARKTSNNMNQSQKNFEQLLIDKVCIDKVFIDKSRFKKKKTCPSYFIDNSAIILQKCF